MESGKWVVGGSEVENICEAFVPDIVQLVILKRIFLILDPKGTLMSYFDRQFSDS